MIYKKSIYVIWLALFLIIGVTYATYNSNIIEEKITLITKERVFNAGEDVSLKFKITAHGETFLLIDGSYGITIVQATRIDDHLIFNFPKHFIEHKGEISWELRINNQFKQKGKIKIIANAKTKTLIESYFGPPSIIAGGRDYAMMVTIPTDSYDNPVKDHTPVDIKHQFLKIIDEDHLDTDYLIAWKNIFSYTKSGRILVSTECNETDSKEFTTIVYADNAVDFTIEAFRKHEFADGNQVTSIMTSIIRDQYGNIVTDGTYVEFIIRNKENNVLKAAGTTIRGVAEAKMLHPDHEEEWKIIAYVTGMAKSNELFLKYAPIKTDYAIEITDNKRTITVGPLKSFMKQIIPNGAVVTLYIYQKNKLVDYKVRTSFKGKVSFELIEDFYPDGNYTLEIEALGVKKRIEKLELW